MSGTARLLLSISVVLATVSPSRADVGLIVLEPVGALGFFTRVGHAGTYLSNICQDGSPIRMRLCRPGESGGVVSKYSPLSENEDYDWAIVPFEEYMHGFGSPELAPMIGTRKLQSAIEARSFGPLFSSDLKATRIGDLPDGQWKGALATRFDRNIYIFSVETSAADDAIIVEAFNSAPNKSKFNFFYRNCSNQAKSIFNLVLPDVDAIGDRTGGITMETPKGLAKALVDLGLEHPELHLRVRRYAQLPGTFGRSREVLFPMENTYRSIGFAPWWLFGGFREVALGAMLYHQVIAPFGMLGSSRDFISPSAARLTIEQHALRERQDEILRALASARHLPRLSRLSELNAEVFRRLGEIRKEKQAEVDRVAGSKAQWREIEREFPSMVLALNRQPFVPEELKRHLAQFEPDGSLSEPLLGYLEANAEFHVDGAGRGPWISMAFVEGETCSTGLSRSQVLAGDPRVAVLVLAAAIDYHLYQSDARREDIEYVNGLFTQFRQAMDAITSPSC